VELVALVVAPLAGIAGVVIGAFMQGRRDDRQWTRDEQREQARWDHERRTRWLDEQYQHYTAIMQSVSEAVWATRAAYELHPSWAAARADAAVAEQRVADARSAVAEAGEAVNAAALVIAPKVREIAEDGVRDMQMIPLVMGWTDTDEARQHFFESLGNVRRVQRGLKAAIRAELGIFDDEIDETFEEPED
jgi:hypothetical protein